MKDLDKPLCPYRDHGKGHMIELPAGYVPLVAVSYVHARGNFDAVRWKPPGAEDYEPIPPNVLYYDRRRADLMLGKPKE